MRCRKKGAKWVCCAGHVSLASGHSHFLSPGLDLRAGFPSPLPLQGATWALFLTVWTRRATLSNPTPPTSHHGSGFGWGGVRKRKGHFEKFLMDADVPLTEQTS